jgi:tRNA G18 (ribose-2'-O)-methylase SpoU
MALIPIDDPADPRLADYRNVPDRELLVQNGVFVAEGRLVVSRLLTGRRFSTRSVLVTDTACRALMANPAFRLEADATGPEAGATGPPGDGPLPIYVVPQWVINAITGFDIHRGCLALGERPAPTPWQDVAARVGPLVILERVADADNVGAVFRNAAAFGAAGVLLDPACTDPLYRKAIRTSMGAVLDVPFARMTPWPEALGELGAQGYTLMAMMPGAVTTLQEALVPAASGYCRKIAIVLGHEGHGLSAEAADACDRRARIAMAHGVDSLNVATACALALYEVSRGD